MMWNGSPGGVAVFDECRKLPVEEREQQRSDVRAVHVGVGHDDDAVIPHLGEIELLHADSAAERGGHASHSSRGHCW